MDNFDTKTEDLAGGDQDIEEVEMFMYQKYLDWLVVEQNALRSLDHIF
jgi:hypothetical protein